VSPKDFELWLDCAKFEAEEAAALIKPADDDLLEAYEVSSAVNRVVNDSAALLERVPAGTAAAAELVHQKLPARPKRTKASDDQASLF
jgi:hypothetical protein